MKANEGKEIPVFERYYLGGINSLRGLREVGPRDPATGDVIGGLTMLNFNFEYIFPLIKNAGMKGLVFFDTGNSWETGITSTICGKRPAWGSGGTRRSVPSVWNGGMSSTRRKGNPRSLGIHDRDVYVREDRESGNRLKAEGNNSRGTGK